MTQNKRDTYKYKVRVGRKVVHGGITNNPERRELEHKQTFGDKAKLTPVGRRTTRDAARQWEKDNGFS